MSEGKVIGTYALQKISDQACELSKFTVSKDFRGRKMGERMLEHAIEKAREDENNQELEELEKRYNEFTNFSFEEIKILPGNVGYLKFNGFQDAINAGPTAVAAMNFLANTDALIRM